MAKYPIDILLDGVDWKPIDTAKSNEGLPYATHAGIFKIGDCSLRVYQLNDGRRVIEESDIIKFFGGGLVP